MTCSHTRGARTMPDTQPQMRPSSRAESGSCKRSVRTGQGSVDGRCRKASTSVELRHLSSGNRNPKLLHAGNERGALEAEAGGSAVGTADAPVRLLEDADNVITLGGARLHHERRRG